MTYEIKVGECYCSCSLTINGIKAYAEDFGDKEDLGSEYAPPYGCGDMQFIPSEPDEEICKKYGISEDEFRKIADILAEKLSWGCCSLSE